MAVEELAGRTLPPGRLSYVVGPAQQAKADKVLTEAGINLAGPLVGMSPGAKWDTKRWPVGRFGELATRALAAGHQVIVTGSPGEAALGTAIKESAPQVADLVGAVDLDVLGGVIARCSAFVANDSGPMHLARALGVPTLAFFGSTDPAQFDFAGHRVLFKSEPCSPCSFYGLARCPKGHLRCLETIEVEEAWQALTQLDQTRSAAAVSG
jgi:ADP-heptose:LPS heptosyltransferase